jgi:DnaJ-class molecular chaperone
MCTDPDKREAYNRGGVDAVQQQEQRANQPAAHDPFSIFEHFGFGGFGRRNQEEARTPSVEIPVRVTLKQLYLGELLDVSYTRQVLCVEANQCQKNNNECQGPGVKMKAQQLAPGFVQQIQVADASCVARGKSWKSPCKACPKGMTEEEEIQLTVDVAAGMANGDKIKFDQIADEAVGHIPGDVLFVIRQAPHELFVRDGDNLRMEMHISLLDSLVGFSKTFRHLDGHEVIVRRGEVTYCSEVVMIRGEGMPVKGRKGVRGDLYITLLIDFPRQFTEGQKQQLRAAIGN